MKLFQQLLVASATVGLIAPISAQASNIVDLEEMSSYSRSKSKSLKLDKNTFTNNVSKNNASLKKSSRLDSQTFINKTSENIAKTRGSIDGFGSKNEFEAGTFSDTTTLDQKAVFAGMVTDHSSVQTDGTDSLSAIYQYTMNLNTSFSGDDNL